MRLWTITFLLVPLSAGVIALAGGPADTRPASVAGGRWAVYYAAEADPVAFAPYDLVVLDSDRHPPLGPLADRGKTLLGYLSLCEVSENRAYFDDLRAAGLLLAEHATWKGAHYVDVRDPRWTRQVVEELIPRLLRRGFTGLFLDTLDDAAWLEGQGPRNRGMRAAAVRLVKTIRRHYPDVLLMMNRGYALLPEVEGDVDAVLGESVHTTYDFAAKRYVRVAPAATAEQVRLLKAAQGRRPSLRLFTLDYWDPADPAGIAAVYREARASGLQPYVATIDLDRVVAEPR